MCRHVPADRAEERGLNAAAAVRTDHHQLRRRALRHECIYRVALDELLLDLDAGRGRQGVGNRGFERA